MASGQTPASGQEGWRCEHCSFLSAKKLKFCPECRSPSEVNKVPLCEKCGEKVPSADMKICQFCTPAPMSPYPVQETLPQAGIEMASGATEGPSSPPAQPVGQPSQSPGYFPQLGMTTPQGNLDWLWQGFQPQPGFPPAQPVGQTSLSPNNFPQPSVQQTTPRGKLDWPQQSFQSQGFSPAQPVGQPSQSPGNFPVTAPVEQTTNWPQQGWGFQPQGFQPQPQEMLQHLLSLWQQHQQQQAAGGFPFPPVSQGNPQFRNQPTYAQKLGVPGGGSWDVSGGGPPGFPGGGPGVPGGGSRDVSDGGPPGFPGGGPGVPGGGSRDVSGGGSRDVSGGGPPGFPGGGPGVPGGGSRDVSGGDPQAQQGVKAKVQAGAAGFIGEQPRNLGGGEQQLQSTNQHPLAEDRENHKPHYGKDDAGNPTKTRVNKNVDVSVTGVYIFTLHALSEYGSRVYGSEMCS